MAESKLDTMLADVRKAVEEVANMAEFLSKHRRITDYSRRYLGGQDAIFKLAGVEKPPNKTPERKAFVWTDAYITSELRKAVSTHGTTTSYTMANSGYKGLIDAVKRNYGTWNAGLVALGYEVAYEFQDTADNLTKEEAKELVLQALAQGVAPQRVALEKAIPKLTKAFANHFDGISDIKEYCGFCTMSGRPKPIRTSYLPNLRNPEGIRREIIRFWYIGAPLNYAYMKNNRRHLLQAANEHIGSWRQAVESIGIDYANITKQVDTNVLSECGTEFEDVFAEILTELNYEYIREGEGVTDIDDTFTLRPDFILPNWRWIDCKLSEWTDIRETLIRYHDENPNGITIVYLRGRNHVKERGRKWKYEHISVYQFTKQLAEGKRKYYEDKLRLIEDKANEGAVAK